MTDAYVFDAEAIIAYLYDEPGYETVEEYLREATNSDREGYLAETNAADVLYLIARFEGIDGRPTTSSLRIADRDIRALERWGLLLERADWQLAAEIKADGHISLADAHAVALADTHDGVLVAGGDDDFDELSVDVTVDRFREGSV